MNIQGIVVGVEFDKQIKGSKGYYTGWEVTYKDDKSGEIKTLAKPVATLKAPKLSFLKPVLDTLEVGDKFNYTIEKEGDFWELTGIGKGDGPQLPQKTSYATRSSGGGRDYETKEERGARQRLIVRQSSLTTAVEFASLNKGVKTKEELFELAEEIESWVFRKD